ncbi:hypothetical protein [Methyloglobulus sp.]|uniref:hypothetical protein n=1 Tax=Methyloglobulus sp. TaxID=2518622 RepID=UPI003988B0C8
MKIIKRTLTLLFVIGGVISCSQNDPIEQLVKQNVILTSGVAFDTGKLVSINPFTSKEIAPCGTTDNIFVSRNPSDTKQGQIQFKPKSNTAPGNCNTKIVALENPSLEAALMQSLKLSKAPIQGTVNDNGQDKPAKLIVTVTALYPGSHCATIYSGGQQFTNCINQEAYCAALAAYGIPC